MSLQLRAESVLANMNPRGGHGREPRLPGAAVQLGGAGTLAPAAGL